MRLLQFVSYLLVALQAVLAVAPPEYSRVLVIVDDKDADLDVSEVSGPLEKRGFDVTTATIKDHPKLSEFGQRLVDSAIIVPGKTKALGSTLRSRDLLEFMELGGNVVALTTPRHNPAAIRELGQQLGLEISRRGVEARNAFNHVPSFPVPSVLSSAGDLEAAELFHGSAVAEIDPQNPYVLGFVQAPYSAYAYNAAKEGEDVPKHALTDAFGLGSELFISAGLQSLHGSRFVWIGAPELLRNEHTAEQLTSWALQERGVLRIANATHSSLDSGETHHHYRVEEPLKYCAVIEQWVPELKGWAPYENIDDVQLEFKMLDPYHRLHLGKDGCVEFVTPEQYGMFTFQIDYKRPGFTFLDDRQVVTVRHRANDEWDRSWSITNSWVYLSGVSTTAIGFLLFVVLYLASPEASNSGASAKSSSSAAEKVSAKNTTGKSAHAATTASQTAQAQDSKKTTRRSKKN